MTHCSCVENRSFNLFAPFFTISSSYFEEGKKTSYLFQVVDLSPFYINKGPMIRREIAQTFKHPSLYLGWIIILCLLTRGVYTSSVGTGETSKANGEVAVAQDIGKSGRENGPRAEVRGQRVPATKTNKRQQQKNPTGFGGLELHWSAGQTCQSRGLVP